MGEERGMRMGITMASEEPTVERLAELEGLILKMIAEQEAAPFAAYLLALSARAAIRRFRSANFSRSNSIARHASPSKRSASSWSEISLRSSWA